MRRASNRTIGLRDGARLVVRPISPADRASLADAYTRLSDESRYRRFMGSKPGLTKRELTYFTEIDHVTHEALIAIDPFTGAVVAEARYAGSADDPWSCDVAVMVVDDWHGRGLGKALLQRLIGAAREAGIVRLSGTMLAMNEPARRLVRSLGFEPRGTSRGESLFELPLAPALLAAAA
jgi:RimJ/RimL family protein N-acetyltransferase